MAMRITEMKHGKAKAAIVFAVLALAAVACLVMMPGVAHAFDWKEFFDGTREASKNIVDGLGTVMDNPLGALENGIDQFIVMGFMGLDNMLFNSESIFGGESTGMDDLLVASFDDMFGNGGAGISKVTDIAQIILKFVGYPVLAILTLVQIVKMANRMDGNATMPTFKEVLFVLIYYCVFYMLITHAIDICNGIYTLSVGLIKMVGSATDMGSLEIFGQVAENYAEYKAMAGGWMGMLVLYFLCLIVSMLTSVVTFAVVLARGIQIYIYTAISPLSLALLGAEETRQYGMGFLKNYIAVCFAGVILLALLILGPIIIQAATKASVLFALAAILVYLYSLLKSGAWARDVLGG